MMMSRTPGVAAEAPSNATRQRRLAQIIAICGATTWRILRFDGDLNSAETELAIAELLVPLLHS